MPAAATTLYSDLGPSNAYNPTTELDIAGSTSIYAFSNNSVGQTVAEEFTISGIGPTPVSEIELAVSNIIGLDTFYAGIFSDNGGVPGTEVPDALWDLSTNIGSGTCCNLVAIDVTGVTLTPGVEYFLVLGPQSNSDSSWNGWNLNSQGATGVSLVSDNGGTTWTGAQTTTLAAFAILSPEPGSWLMIAFGAAAIITRARYKR